MPCTARDGGINMDDNNRFFDEPDNEASSAPEDTVETTASAQSEDTAQDDTPWYQQQSGNYSQSYQSQSGYSSDSEPSYSPYSSQSTQTGAYQTYQAPQDNKPDNNSSKKKGKKVLAVILAAVIVFCAGFGAYLIKGSKDEAKKEAETSQGDAQLQINDSPTNAESISSDGALTAKEIYEKVSPSCVGIILYSTGSSLFSSNGSSGSKSSIAGEGSGIIMGTNKSGDKTYVITCAHVISSANSSGYKVVVQDKDGEQYDATVVGYDSKTDLGVLSIDKTGFTAANFGDSSKLSIGETVYAIGNPGGTEFFGSYTRGMVSAIDRSVNNEIGYDMKCIQHDAAINPGNSGGALINSNGQIIGINSSKIASTEYEGMGFAIPITSAKPIIDDIIANGYVTNRPKLGISYAPATSYQQYAMVVQIKGLPSGSLIIAKINSDSAFTGTKAQVGDLIIKVNGEEMKTADVLLDKIENGNVGDKLTLTLCRISENYEISEFDVTVTLIEDNGQTEAETTTSPWNSFFGY